MGQAVAASCAIPGYFAPVVVDGVRYVDGGAHSTTNLAESIPGVPTPLGWSIWYPAGAEAPAA